MIYTITFKKSAEKEFEKLPSQIIRRISTAIDALAKNPWPPGSKKLEGQKESLWRIRIGDYRVIYLVEDVIKIVEIRRLAIAKTSTCRPRKNPIQILSNNFTVSRYSG